MSADTNTLESMCELIVDCPHSTPKWTDSGLIVLRNNNIKNGRLDLSNPSFTDEEHFQQRIKRAQPSAGDIVFTREAPMGEVCMIPAEVKCCLGQRQVLLRPKKEICGKYLFFALQSPAVQYEISWNEGTGSTVSNVRIPILKNLNIPRHPGNEDEIAEILSSLDDKIELNRQINQTLEEMAQAIFKSWFVDFEPVKAKTLAKANGRDPERAAMSAISGKSDAELDRLSPAQLTQLRDTAALFPDELVESELGLIPRGWEVKSISDISKFATGKIDVSSLGIENYVSTENMLENKGGVRFASSLPSVSTVPSFSKGQVLISNIRPYFKKIWLASFDGGRSNDVLAFNPTQKECTEFLYNLLYQDTFFDFMMRTSKGAKMPRGDKNAITDWKFVCSDHALRSFFSEYVRPYYFYIASLNAEMTTLTELRDTLLPKLLSGEISVGKAITTNEEVAV